MNRILMVEDDLNIAKSLSHLLASEGYSVVLADTQKGALAMIENEHFDLRFFGRTNRYRPAWERWI